MAFENNQPKSNARGGRRAGAGRKPGSATRKTREIADAAADTGITPLEYMLSLLRDKDLAGAERFEAAKAAAPYMHPRLSSLDMNARIDVLTDEDREWLGDGG